MMTLNGAKVTAHGMSNIVPERAEKVSHAAYDQSVDCVEGRHKGAHKLRSWLRPSHDPPEQRDWRTA